MPFLRFWGKSPLCGFSSPHSHLRLKKLLEGSFRLLAQTGAETHRAELAGDLRRWAVSFRLFSSAATRRVPALAPRLGPGTRLGGFCGYFFPAPDHATAWGKARQVSNKNFSSHGVTLDRTLYSRGRHS